MRRSDWFPILKNNEIVFYVMVENQFDEERMAPKKGKRAKRFDGTTNLRNTSNKLYLRAFNKRGTTRVCAI